MLRHGSLEVCPARHAVTWDTRPVRLTATEFAILEMLIRQPGRVFSRDTIMDAAYGHEAVVSDRTIDSHIRHIRQKFADAGCPALIETLHGVGYTLIRV